VSQHEESLQVGGGAEGLKRIRFLLSFYQLRMATLKLRKGYHYTEVPFPKTLEECGALLLRSSGSIDSPSPDGDGWRRLYEAFGKQEGFIVEREDEFIRWIALQTQKINITRHENRRKDAEREKKRREAAKQRHKKQMKQLHEEKVQKEAQKRIQEQRFEAAVQKKIQELTPAGSSLN